MIDTIIRPKDDITWHVIQDLLSRANRGVEKYSTTLQENNRDEFLNHLYEELLDAAQYIKKEITIRQTVHQLAKDYTNDKELGEVVRRIYG